jgi:hypothetical protein
VRDRRCLPSSLTVSRMVIRAIVEFPVPDRKIPSGRPASLSDLGTPANSRTPPLAANHPSPNRSPPRRADTLPASRPRSARRCDQASSAQGAFQGSHRVVPTLAVARSPLSYLPHPTHVAGVRPCLSPDHSADARCAHTGASSTAPQPTASRSTRAREALHP